MRGRGSAAAGFTSATGGWAEGRGGAAVLAQPKYVRHCGLGQKSTSPGFGNPHFGQSLTAASPSDSFGATEVSSCFDLSARQRAN